jgi:hypothetical protein
VNTGKLDSADGLKTTASALSSEVLDAYVTQVNSSGC